MQCIERVGKECIEEAATLRGRFSDCKDLQKATAELRQKLEQAKKELLKEMSGRWKKWSREAWKTRKKAIYRWAGGRFNAATDKKWMKALLAPTALTGWTR